MPYDKLLRVAQELDQRGEFVLADELDNILLSEAKKSDKKWMQKAVNPKEKGELRKKMKKGPKSKLTISELEVKKKRLQEKGKGDKKMSDADRETLQQVVFAINAIRSSKKK